MPISQMAKAVLPWLGETCAVTNDGCGVGSLPTGICHQQGELYASPTDVHEYGCFSWAVLCLTPGKDLARPFLASAGFLMRSVRNPAITSEVV